MRVRKEMTVGDEARRLHANLRNSLTEFHDVDYAQFAEVADLLTVGYERLVQRGVKGQVVAHAMLGATLNLYDLFEMSAELPSFFRELADYIEREGGFSARIGEA